MGKSCSLLCKLKRSTGRYFLHEGGKSRGNGSATDAGHKVPSVVRLVESSVRNQQLRLRVVEFIQETFCHDEPMTGAEWSFNSCKAMPAQLGEAWAEAQPSNGAPGSIEVVDIGPRDLASKVGVPKVTGLKAWVQGRGLGTYDFVSLAMYPAPGLVVVLKI